MIRVLIQAEAGSHHKLRYDEKTLTAIGEGKVSRPYPYAYGFVVATTAADGDNADCYVVGNAHLKSGTIVECEPVGLLEQVESGVPDHKVLAVLVGQEAVVPERALEVLQDFIYAVFSDFPDESVTVGPIHSRDAALQYVRECQDA
jgi:inorganic pyrophosphatase